MIGKGLHLPDGREDIDPNFQHYNKSNIPLDENKDRKVSLVAGEGFGLKSPVVTSSPLVFASIEAKTNFEFDFKPLSFEMAVFLINGSAKIGEEEILENQMLAFEPKTLPRIKVSQGSHLVLLGGEPFATPRHIWWNLVSSSREKIEEAKLQWKTGVFPMVPGETEFIPLPNQ